MMADAALKPVLSRWRAAAPLIASALFALLIAVCTAPASAKIRCKGIFQVNKTGLVSTQICRDRQIARVARSYGWRVSDAEVRNNPLKKVEICQAMGGDTRLQGACGAYGPQNLW
ncbi:hypothetical protein [Methyloceanibacter caenitepidi]|nr:hypothetical protein [Methyloceanibacter caenitepidi]